MSVHVVQAPKHQNLLSSVMLCVYYATTFCTSKRYYPLLYGIAQCPLSYLLVELRLTEINIMFLWQPETNKK